MITSGAPTSTPPTGSTGTAPHPDRLLHGLRRGEREAFARYFELYRSPVHALVWRLLRGGDDAVSATGEVFTRVYRRILLHDGPLDLSGWTYGAALDVCRERLDERAEREAGRGAEGRREAEGLDAGGRLRRTGPTETIGAGRRDQTDLGRRMGQALGMLEFRQQAALLLHDVDALRPAELASVFGLKEDAAGALLFRAREEFRRAFEEVSSDRRAAACRLAEQTAAGAVGRGLSDDEARRLEAHAGYCRHCRQAMKGWGEGAVTLALFLEDAPLPDALATTPVFGTAIAIAGASTAASDPGPLKAILARIGRSMTSRAAAYAVAAICLAAAIGLAVQQSPGSRVFVSVPSGVPGGAAYARPDSSVARPSATRDGQVATSSVRSPTVVVASAAWYAGAVGPAVTALADVGPPSAAGGPAAGLLAAEADRTGAASLKGNDKGDTKKPKDGDVSAGRGRSGMGSGNYAGSADKAHGKAPKHVPASGTKHVTKTKKDDAGKHQKPAKPAKDH